VRPESRVVYVRAAFRPGIPEISGRRLADDAERRGKIPEYLAIAFP
jgi:hypothetical protein